LGFWLIIIGLNALLCLIVGVSILKYRHLKWLTTQTAPNVERLQTGIGIEKFIERHFNTGFRPGGRGIVREPFDLTDQDPNITKANAAAAVWSDVYKYQAPVGVGLILQADHMFSIYLADTLGVESAKFDLVKIEVRDSSEQDKRTVYGPAYYLKAKEFQDRNKIARLNVSAPVPVLERQWIVVMVKGTTIPSTKNSHFSLLTERLMQSLFFSSAEIRQDETILIAVNAATLLDQLGDYKLVDFRNLLHKSTPCPYLWMRNPSVDRWHLEGVPEYIKTVQEALHARKPEALKRIPISDEIGEDWYQQGNVCIWPEDAIVIKSKPVIMT
jgi:hypothetical protein